MNSTVKDRIEITAADGHRLGVYRARPTGEPRGSVLIIQEIFGVTAHIKAVADAYAEAGYEALAPQLFDRITPDLTVPYSDISTGLAHAYSIDTAFIIRDLDATQRAAARPDQAATVGFCWGGRLSYQAACRLNLKAAVIYYGGGLPSCLPETPSCPTLFHFGEQDTAIPQSDVEQMRTAVTTAEIHLYPSGHAFNNTDRASYEPVSAALSLSRTLAFLQRHLG